MKNYFKSLSQEDVEILTFAAVMILITLLCGHYIVAIIAAILEFCLFK